MKMFCGCGIKRRVCYVWWGEGERLVRWWDHGSRGKLVVIVDFLNIIWFVVDGCIENQLIKEIKQGRFQLLFRK